MGKALREKCPHESHAIWKPTAGRHNPVQLVLDANKGRMPDLLPMRHGRMAASPFTFYRGAALNMAADLSTTPSSGIIIQCCGDAHLMNFGGFATPERRIIMSINDLDETNPAPWEWDLKRLATSFVIASRNNDLGETTAKEMAEACVKSYREHMLEFSQMKPMELWYYAFDAEKLIKSIDDPKIRKIGEKRLRKEQAKAKTLPEEMFPKLTSSGTYGVRIQDELPSIFHVIGADPAQMEENLQEGFRNYKATLAPAYQVLLNHYQLRDIAFKVVGIGSVGTFCGVLLLMDADGNPFFLQVKEARESVLEKYAGKSVFENHGQRIVNGYRLMQPYSDIFLGWTHGQLGNRDFFVRQLRDMKIKFYVEIFDKKMMELYADWCGKCLALSHARSGESSKLAGYMGKGDSFDKAIASFAVAYANQNEKDYIQFRKAVKSGKVEAVFEEA